MLLFSYYCDGSSLLARHVVAPSHLYASPTSGTFHVVARLLVTTAGICVRASGLVDICGGIYPRCTHIGLQTMIISIYLVLGPHCRLCEWICFCSLR